jgi:hypothetical protein
MYLLRKIVGTVVLTATVVLVAAADARAQMRPLTFGLRPFGTTPISGLGSPTFPNVSPFVGTPTAFNQPFLGGGFNLYGGGINGAGFASPGGFNTGAIGQSAILNGVGLYGGAGYLGGGLAGGGGGYGGGYGTGGYGSGSSGYTEDPTAGFLRGTASLITADATFANNLQQAALQREKLRQTKAETRRKEFDEANYERAKTATAEESRQQQLAADLSRSRGDPPRAEVLSGHALNVVLGDLKTLAATGLPPGPGTPLDEDVIRHLNLRAASAGNPGLLKAADRIPWPQAFQGDGYLEERRRVNSLMTEAAQQAARGRVDPGVQRDLAAAAAALHKELSAAAGQLSANHYVEASRFVGNLEDAVKTLARSEAAELLRPSLAAGTGVADLVRYLASHEFVFAPAVPGDEAAYQAAHRALVAYDLDSRSPRVSAR